MRILLNDFGGYPYPVELARSLAQRGHDVLHLYCASLQTTPQGTLQPLSNDPPSLTIRGLALREPLDKYSFVKRWKQERAYGQLAAAQVRTFLPDVVISANMPLDAQALLYKASRAANARFVFWLQDVIGIAAARILRKKIPLGGRLIGAHYLRMEARLLRASDAVVPITDDFKPLLHKWGVDSARVTTIENWAPLAELPLVDKDPSWIRGLGLDPDRFLFVYAGTLALKHNPDLLLQLALRFQAQGAQVAVLSQGPGADWLAQQKAALKLDNLVIPGFRSFSQMPQAFAAADVLVAVLEPDAGVFSVPSKVLAYLCGGRPLLAAMPLDNLASRIIRSHDAGVVVAPHDIQGFLAGAELLLNDPQQRHRQGAHARAYATQTFDIRAIAEAMERVLAPAPTAKLS